MEIIVEGYQEKYVTPDEVIININFIEKDKTYEKVLEKGIKLLLIKTFLQRRIRIWTAIISLTPT